MPSDKALNRTSPKQIENLCSEVSEKIYPHYMDADKRKKVEGKLLELVRAIIEGVKDDVGY